MFKCDKLSYKKKHQWKNACYSFCLKKKHLRETFKTQILTENMQTKNPWRWLEYKQFPELHNMLNTKS